MKITDEYIKQYMYKQKDILFEEYKPENILGFYVYGKALYGFAETDEDIQVAAIYVPTFEQMCFDQRLPYNYEYKGIKIIDIRYLYYLMMEQDFTIMECIFSDYMILNPKYYTILQDVFYIDRETLFRLDKRQRMIVAVQRGREAVARGDLFEASRIRIGCQLFTQGVSIENCIKLKKEYHLQYLKSIKSGSFKPDVDEIEEDFKQILIDSEKFRPDPKAEQILKDCILQVMKVAVNPVSNTSFKNSLTDAEKQALEVVLSLLKNNEGDISLVQIVKDAPVARPAFTTLFQKLEKNCVAEITNRGFKGTHIKILQPEVLK